ncbi:galactokinase [Stackebrandtia albiflava]|uniref:Galactokinase n=1 Tax=Stackebrandtia albiflava TaxID=406432 RepID=A0A562V341_9ACTN|nr:galactokinase [Stackebrandtia albiflava]
MDDLIRRARNGFTRAFGGKPDGCWAAPGRINVLGEHTDYNDGYVLPYAIPYYTVAAVARSESPTWQVWSEATGETVTFGPGRVREELPRDQAVSGWAGYVAGVVWSLRHMADAPVGGARIAIASDVPTGAGLSSSAALELSVLLALCDLFGVDLPDEHKVLVAQHAENEYVGAPTGILDQTASLRSLPDSVLFMDCRSGVVEALPFPLAESGLDMIVVDTRAPHRHSDGEYADRRADCERAAKLLGLDSLRDVRRGEALTLPDQVLRRRVRHVRSENHRTRTAADRLRAGDTDLRFLGELMLESHLSLAADFEVTVPELDHTVEAALRGGAWGARMTGGGFGGSVICLVNSDRSEEMCRHVAEVAARQDFPEPRFYTATPAAGAHRLADLPRDRDHVRGSTYRSGTGHRFAPCPNSDAATSSPAPPTACGVCSRCTGSCSNPARPSRSWRTGWCGRRCSRGCCWWDCAGSGTCAPHSATRGPS